MPSLSPLAQLAFAACAATPAPDACALVERAARLKRMRPPDVRARDVASEITILERHGTRASAIQVERVRARATPRDGIVSVEILDHRTVGAPAGATALSLLRDGWVVLDVDAALRPTVRMPPGSGLAGRAAAHPLDEGRDSLYRFIHGDTATLVLPRGEQVVVHRVLVVPREHAMHDAAVVFQGVLELDRVSGALVRMRGMLRATEPPEARWRRWIARGMAARYFVEIVPTREEGGPSSQRLEMHVASPLVTGPAMILRVVTTVQAAGDTADPHPDMQRSLPLAIDAFDDVASARWGAPRATAPTSEVRRDTSWVARWSARLEGAGRRVRLPGLTADAEVRRESLDDALLGAAGIGWRGSRWEVGLGVQRPLVNHGLLPMPDPARQLVALRGGTSGGTRTGGARLDERVGPARLRSVVGAADARGGTLAVSAPCALALQPRYGPLPGRNLHVGGAVDVGTPLSDAIGARGAHLALRAERVDCVVAQRRLSMSIAARGGTDAVGWALRLDGASIASDPLAALPVSMDALIDPSRRERAARIRRQAVRSRVSAALAVPARALPVRTVLGLWLPVQAPSLVVTLEGGWNRALVARPDHPSTRGSAATASAEVTLRPLGGGLDIGVARAVAGGGGWRFVLVHDGAW